MKKIVSLLMLLVLITSLWSSAFATVEEVNFSDLSSDHWAYPYVAYMVENGIVSGYPDGTFKPNDPFSRAAFATLLYKTFELAPATSPIDFVDLPSTHWAYPYVQGSAQFLTYFEYDTGIYYKPNDYSVREDVAVAMVVASGADDIYTPDHSVLDGFADADEISPELKDYVALAVQVGIMNGSDGYFYPQEPLTRAQACTVFAKYAMNIADQLAAESQPVKRVVGEDTADEPMTIDEPVTAETNDVVPAVEPTSENSDMPDGGYYRFKEVIAKETGAYWNTDEKWNKVTSLTDGKAVMQMYDPTFDRGHTDGTGYEIIGVATWSTIPKYILPDTRYTIKLNLSLEKNYNPEKAYVYYSLYGLKTSYNDDNSLSSAVFMTDSNGNGTLNAGNPDKPEEVGGTLELIYEAPGPNQGKIGYEFRDDSTFEYYYIYEWVE
jgi:hypothetical protein